MQMNIVNIFVSYSMICLYTSLHDIAAAVLYEINNIT